MHYIYYINIYIFLGLVEIVNNFRARNFSYTESRYSSFLWTPFLICLFGLEFDVRTEFPLTDIDQTYKNNFIDFVVTPSTNEIATILYLELSKDHLVASSHVHKDETKIAEAMGAGLLKNISLLKYKGYEIIKKLRVYGILAGATDFDLCKIYPVWPNPEDLNDFYMVFDSSTTDLRFRIFESNKFGQVMCEGADDAVQVGGEPICGFESSGAPQNFVSSAWYGRIPNGIKAEEIECRRVLSHGFINERSLQVLEKLGQLVEIQRQLLSDVDMNQADPNIKFSRDQIGSMTQGRSKHSYASDKEGKRAKIGTVLYDQIDVVISEEESSDDVLEEAFENIGHTEEKENESWNENKLTGEKVLKLFPVDEKSKYTATIEKRVSKYEIVVYEKVKEFPFYPKLYASKVVENGDGSRRMLLKLDCLVPLVDKLEYSTFEADSAVLFCSKLLVDLIGALWTLHQLGFVHGDLTPGNIGYSPKSGTFQLFDFDQSRTISDAKAGIGHYRGTEDFRSDRFRDTGLYSELDDYVGLMKTCDHAYSRISGQYDFTEEKEFRPWAKPFIIDEANPNFYNRRMIARFYTEMVKVYWERSGRNLDDPTIKNVQYIINNRNFYK